MSMEDSIRMQITVVPCVVDGRVSCLVTTHSCHGQEKTTFGVALVPTFLNWKATPTRNL